MDEKLLTEAGWKAVATDHRIKDNGLQRALAAYEKADEEDYDERLKCLAQVSQLAGTLRKAKEVATQPDAVKYLAGVAAAAEAEKAEINKIKAMAAKSQALAQKKAEAEARAEGTEDEEEEEQGEFHVKLLAAFQKLKSAKGLAYQFIVCDAKPCGLMVAKKITSKHKQELTNITNSKRFLHLGTCQFEEGKYVFAMEKPVLGLARKLQESIKYFTGKKLPVKVGTETAEAEEEQVSGTIAGAPVAQPTRAELIKAPELWHATMQEVEAKLDQLKTAIRKQFAGEAPELVADIEKNMTTVDAIVHNLDQRLTDSLAKANAAKDGIARATELSRSKIILADYMKYVKVQEPFILHLDSNPFGVKTDVLPTLMTVFKQVALAVGQAG